MDSRIRIEEKDDQLMITILALFDTKKQQILLYWIVMFSICGVLIFSQFFFDYDNKAKLFFAIYVAFWAFFEFKVIYAYRWRKSGKEKIIVSKKELHLIKEIGRRGITQKYENDDIENLSVLKDEDGGFFKYMNTSYWNINKYSLVFMANNLKVPFGIDLSESDAHKICKKIKQFMS